MFTNRTAAERAKQIAVETLDSLSFDMYSYNPAKRYADSLRLEENTLTSDELEVMGATPKESIWNWAKGNIGEAPGIYLANAQGRSQYGNRMLGGISSIVPNSFVCENTFEKQPKLSYKDLAELEFLKRMVELNKKPGFDKYIEKPKLPEKFKKYKDDPRIIEIFGAQED